MVPQIQMSDSFLFQPLLLIAFFSFSGLNLFGQSILNSDQSVLSSKHARLKDLVVKKVLTEIFQTSLLLPIAQYISNSKTLVTL